MEALRDRGRAGEETAAGCTSPDRGSCDSDPDEMEDIRTRCLGILQRIARGADPHASPGHRLQAAALYERYAPVSSDALWLEWEKELREMSEPRLDIELKELVDEGSDDGAVSSRISSGR